MNCLRVSSSELVLATKLDLRDLVAYPRQWGERGEWGELRRQAGLDRFRPALSCNKLSILS